MAQFRRLTQEDIAAIQPRRRKGVSEQRKATAETYRDNLRQYQAGDWVEVTLEPEDKRDTVKARLKRAAQALDMQLDFKRTRGERLRFQIK